jgi:hypothetical protein
MVDLETHSVVDVLPDRSASSVAKWLRQHSGVEVVCRDRHGLYAEGARQGAPQARQVADRFHLIDNLRERLEQQMSGPHASLRSAGASPTAGETPEPDEAVAQHRRHALLEQFNRVKNLLPLGEHSLCDRESHGVEPQARRQMDTAGAIARSQQDGAHDRKSKAYHAHLSRRWTEAVTQIRWLLDEVRRLGYMGCRSRLAEYISPWRTGSTAARASAGGSPTLPVDPTTGT